MSAAIAPSPAKPVLRGWSHAVAAVAAATLCPIVIATAPGGSRAAAAIFTSAVIGLFAMSALYHRFHWGERLHTLFRRLDHTMIFVMIAATYTPIAAVAVGGRAGWIILALVWFGALSCAASQWIWPHAPRAVQVVQYTGVGWLAVVVIDDIWHALGAGGFTLLVVGGVLHTIGALVYATQRPNPWPRVLGFHEIFHLLVVGAVALHYVAVVFYALPQTA